MAGNCCEGGLPPRWTDSESEAFLELGPILTPWRDEVAAALCDLIPAEPDEAFVAVDLGSGDAWLSQAVLERFPRAHVIALDGSPVMLDAARRRLAAFGRRAEVRPFELGSQEWLKELRGPVRCFLSCLVVHHLDDAGKRRLFAVLHRRLEHLRFEERQSPIRELLEAVEVDLTTMVLHWRIHLPQRPATSPGEERGMSSHSR